MSPLNSTEKQMRVHGVELYADASPTPGTAAISKVSFVNPAVWDSDGFFDATHPERVTVPQGFRGRYAVRLTIRWSVSPQSFTVNDRDNGFFYAEIATNAHPDGRFQETRISAAPVANSTKTVMQILWDGALVKDHFLEVNLQYDLPLPRPVVANIWFAMRWLGRQG